MISTFIGAAHFNNGVLSIEPNSRNLIIYADNSPRDNSISIRGPFTIDTAIENESDIIRMPSDAMMTLGIKPNDTIEIDNEIYNVNDTRPGEGDILRLPIYAKKDLEVVTGDVIQNSRLKELFSKAIITHSYEKDNTTFKEIFKVSSRDKNATSYEVFINNESIANSTGIFKNNATYDVNINGKYYTSIKFMNDTSFEYGNNTVDIIFKPVNSTSIKEFVRDSQGYFLKFYFD